MGRAPLSGKLERLQRLSKRYGTTIAIEQNVGLIRVPRTTTSEAR